MFFSVNGRDWMRPSDMELKHMSKPANFADKRQRPVRSAWRNVKRRVGFDTLRNLPRFEVLRKVSSGT
jgi:hypothetical protein